MPHCNSGRDGKSLAIAISSCDFQAENTFFVREFRGRVGPATSAWSPPGNGSQQGCVFVRCADVFVVSVCMLTVMLLVRLVWSLSGFYLDSKRAGEALGHLVSEVLCLLLLLVLLA